MITISLDTFFGFIFFFSSRRRHTRWTGDWSSDVCSSDLMERRDALIAANHVRLRPILMTTLAIVAGMLPIAFGRGAGAGSRSEERRVGKECRARGVGGCLEKRRVDRRRVVDAMTVSVMR